MKKKALLHFIGWHTGTGATMFKNMHYWLTFICCCFSLEAKTVYRLTAKIDQEIDYQSAASQLFSIGSQIRVSNSNNGQFVDLRVVKLSAQPGIYLAATTFSLLDATVGAPLIVTLLEENTTQIFDELADIRGSDAAATSLGKDHLQLQLPEGEYHLPLPPLFSNNTNNSVTPTKPNGAPLYTTPSSKQVQENEIFMKKTPQNSSYQAADSSRQQPPPRSPLLNDQSRFYKNSNSEQTVETPIPPAPSAIQKTNHSQNNYATSTHTPLQSMKEQVLSEDGQQAQTSSQFFDSPKSRFLTPPALSIPAQPQSTIQQLQPSIKTDDAAPKIPLQKQLSSPSLSPSLQTPPKNTLPWSTPTNIDTAVAEQKAVSHTQQESALKQEPKLYFVQVGAYQRIQGVKDFLKLYHDIYPYKLEKVKKQPKRLIRCLLGPFELIEAQQVQKALKRKKRESFLVPRP